MDDKAWTPVTHTFADSFVVIAPYEKGADDTATRVNAVAALAKRVLFDNPDWKACNGGLRETIATGGITTIAEVAGVITLTMVAPWESAENENVIIPLVFHNDKSVPHELFKNISSKTDHTIEIDNSSGIYSTDDSAWSVYLIGAIHGSPVAIDGNEVDLPYSKSTVEVLGCPTPVKTEEKQDGVTATGSVTFLRDNKLVKHQGGGTAVNMNAPGETIDIAIAGNKWVVNGWNKLGYSTGLFAVQVIDFSGLGKSSANVGQVFATQEIAYDCRLTNRGGTEGREAGGTDPYKKTISYETSLEPEIRTIVYDASGLKTA